jgi:hypothetical protein
MLDRSRFHRGWHFALRAVLSLAVLISGLEIATHEHLPVGTGWHDAAPHHHGTDDHAVASCAVCRLAHESGATPAVLAALARPESVREARTFELRRRPGVRPVPSASPRAPPAPRAC